MNCPNKLFSPHTLTLLLQIKCLPNPFIGMIHEKAPATQKGLQKLVDLKLIACIDETRFKITERGAVYLDHLLHTKLPQQRWVIPK